MATLPKGFCLLALAVVAACGDSDPPRPTAPSLTTLTVTGSDLLLVGQSETFAAVGNTGPLDRKPWWGTDAPGVVTVEGYTGRVTAVGTGTATIFADFGAIRGTKTIQTLQNFAGSWSGRYEQTGCEATGDWAVLYVCPDSPWDFATGAMIMTLTQDRDTVSGGFAFGHRVPATDLSGRVSPDGTLTLTGTARGPIETVELRNVRFELLQGEMTGTFEQLYSSSNGSLSGTRRIFAKLARMRRF